MFHFLEGNFWKKEQIDIFIGNRNEYSWMERCILIKFIGILQFQIWNHIWQSNCSYLLNRYTTSFNSKTRQNVKVELALAGEWLAADVENVQTFNLATEYFQQVLWIINLMWRSQGRKTPFLHSRTLQILHTSVQAGIKSWFVHF